MLRAFSESRPEVPHGVEEASLSSEARVYKIGHIVHRTVVESYRDDPVTCVLRRLLFRRRKLPGVDEAPQGHNLESEVRDHAQIDGKGNVIVARVIIAHNMMRVIREHQHPSP